MTGLLLNTHWFGGVDSLPPNAVYIGRPGPHGNSFSSKNGQYSKEDCVALHRVNLYLQLKEDPAYFDRLKSELDGRDLACWCAIRNRCVACHGLNFFHIFKPINRNRDYTKSVYDYLIEDFLFAINGLKALIKTNIEASYYLDWDIAIGEVRLEIGEVFRLFKERDTEAYLRCVWLSTFVIDLELALADPDTDMRLYRLDRVVWNAFRFSFRPTSREGEPSLPTAKSRKPKKDTK